MTKPLFISGPSGVGKSHLTRHLIRDFNGQKVVTLTTRPPRKGDIHEVTYEFVSTEEFEFLEKTHQLAVADRLFNHRYGLRKGSIETALQNGNVPICEVYSAHIQLFVDIFPDAIFIFLMPKSLDFLEQRLRNRGDQEEDLLRRLTSAKTELDVFAQSTHKYFTRIYNVSEISLVDIANDIAQTFFKASE